ncbi:HAD-IIB family hydrolase [uncultured Sharpea sp.]|uniref:HAD-IIB family hydrolase n=1 Tax=uncultured Sharpea sp. TaxID=1112738 RepID=UPI0025902395|nr:HAD-IIB family hydrolase [uncultured Sharpea sp.]
MILFTDLDGTLLDNGKVKTQKDIDALHQFQDAGGIVAICTGRSKFEVVPAIEQGLPYNYMILNNGGEIYDGEKAIIEHRISQKAGVEILDMLVKEKHLYSYFANDDEQLSYYQGKCAYFPSHKPTDLDFIDEYHRSHGFTILCTHQDTDDFSITQKYMDIINENYRDEAIAHRNEIFLDIVPAHCSKGTGIKDLVHYLGDKHRTFGIGDSYNDLSMIEMCDVGATFHFSDLSIKEKVQKSYSYVYEFIDDILGGYYELER